MRELTVPPTVGVTDDERLTDMVVDNAREVPDLVGFARPGPGGWTDVTEAQFADEVRALARGLVAAGIAAGDRVALMSATRYEWTLLDYAIWWAGAVVVPLYESSSAEQVEWILTDSAAVAILVETDAHEALVRSLDAAPPLLWRLDALEVLVDAGAGVSEADLEARRTSVRADDLATLVYTSGTTGRPKGCAVTHRNLLVDVRAGIAALGPVFAAGGGSTLLFLPLAHVFGRVVEIGSVLNRDRLGHCGDVRELPERLRTFRPTYLIAVPRIFEKAYVAAQRTAYAGGKARVFDAAERTAVAYSQALSGGRVPLGLRARHAVFDKLVYAKIRAALGGRCRHALSGGAALGARLGHFFRGAGVVIYEGYGLTETSGGATLNLADDMRIGTVGRPVPGTGVRIADDGEVLLRGPNVFAGYWQDPDATAEVFEGEWFRTGDLGELDADGFLSVTGRKKDIIITAGGKNVAPALLEDRLRAHPLIAQAMVVGDRQPFIGALVTVDEEAWPGWLAAQGRPAGLTVAELRDDPALRAAVQEAVDAANEAVSRAESIREFRILPADFTEATGELTPSLKVRRSEVLKKYADVVASIYT